MLDEIDLEKYKTHPRVLEIRLILLYDLFEREFGLNKAENIFENFIKMFKCQEAPIKAVLNKRFDIKRGSMNSRKRTWRQEVIFMGMCYGESTYKMCKDFLGITPSNLYNQSELYDPKSFITQDWLAKLDKQTNSSFENFTRVEINRFLEGINGLTNVLYTWKGGR